MDGLIDPKIDEGSVLIEANSNDVALCDAQAKKRPLTNVPVGAKRKRKLSETNATRNGCEPHRAS